MSVAKMTDDQMTCASLLQLLARGVAQLDDLLGLDELKPLFEVGLINLEGRRYEQAERLFRAAIALRVDLPLSYLFLGKTYEAQGSWTDAEVAYRAGALVGEQLERMGHPALGLDELHASLRVRRPTSSVTDRGAAR